MTKILCLGLITFSLFGAQTFAEIKVGIKAGGNAQHMWSVDDGISGFKLGLAGGFFSRFRFVEVLAVQPEILFAMKGGKFVDQFDTTAYLLGKGLKTNSIETIMYSIEIPLLFKIYPAGYYNAKPHVLLGPFYEYVISRKIVPKCNFKSSQVYPCSDAGFFKKPVSELGEDEKNIFGIVLGGGFDFGLGTCDLRYTVGVKAVEKSPPKSKVSDPVLRENTGTLTILFGFLF